MQFNKVEICGVNTSELKLLREDEKTQLLRQVRAGDMAAREELVKGNLRLVLSVVQRFANRGENLDDLFQVGCIGLIKAIDNFDISLDVRFSTYAVPMVIGEIRRYLRDNNSVRVSRSMRDIAYKAMQVKERVSAEESREPRVEEICRCMRRSIPTAATPSASWIRWGTAPTTMTGWMKSCCGRRYRSCPPAKNGFLRSGSCRARRRWRWPAKWAYRRHRCPGWKKAPFTKSNTTQATVIRNNGGCVPSYSLPAMSGGLFWGCGFLPERILSAPDFILSEKWMASFMRAVSRRILMRFVQNIREASVQFLYIFQIWNYFLKSIAIWMIIWYNVTNDKG